MKTAVKNYTNKDAIWTNAAGDDVPLKFVPKVDKVKESLSNKIRKMALEVECSIQQFHNFMNDCFIEVDKLIKEEYSIKNSKEKKKGKGSLTWYNFDKSIKVEADINDIAKWDNALMTEAQELLNQYISSNLSENNDLIKGLVTDAFSNSKNQIDSRKVFQILKYETKIKNTKFLKACDLIKQAQSIDKTKLYMRVWEKMEDGSYRNINLNFSSI
ncbi:MAG: DUF3164 family protein [Bacteroidetes bacterium]|nr:DUF3164 family protein [Bacteroidota bacterium]MBS1672133.1 DUF3164 family protein [Bacteroidota bacterium]